MKKILTCLLALSLVVCAALSFAACSNDVVTGTSSSKDDNIVSSSSAGGSSDVRSESDNSVADSSTADSSNTGGSTTDSSNTGDSTTDSSDTGDSTTDSSEPDDSTTDSSKPDDSTTDSSDSSGSDNGDNPPAPPQIPETTELIPIDYGTMTYVGTSLKDFSALFDEQNTLGDPRYDILNGIFPKFPSSLVTLYDADGNGDITEKDREYVYEITIDLGAEHYIDCIYVFFDKVDYSITLETGEPFKYDNIVTASSDSVGWLQIDLKTFTRYINVKYNNGQAATEIILYGARTGEYDVVNTEKHDYKNFDYFLGINGNQADATSTLSCANYFRDYVNWLWCFERSVYPQVPGTTYSGSMSNKYDVKYVTMKRSKLDAVPCYMFGPSDFTTESVSDFMKPETYVMYGELMFQSALRFGYNENATDDMVKILHSQQTVYNRNAIKWIEAGNEPNGEGNDGFSPYELAVFTSTAYDGHCNTVVAPTGSGVGVINANANVKMAMAGLAGVGVRYIQAMSFWMEHNRPDGELALDAFNVHTYCKKLISFNGYQVYVGVCPEIGKITQYVKQLCDWRDKYYPDKEVWLTEFGWDTNTSYGTENACHPYADFTARQLQAMWLVRAYFMFAEAGVDRAAMYMAQDLGDEATSVGKYGTSGVISYSGEYKDSYYYIYTLKNNMGDMHFAEVIDSGNENVWIYRFENDSGKSCYAVWCPTMDNIRVDGYELNIDGTTSYMVEFENGNKKGVSTDLTVENGTVTVDVSEVPVLIFSE